MQVSGKDTTKRVDCEPETACLNAEKRLCFVQFAVAAWARVCVGTLRGRTGADQRGQPYPQGLKIRVCFPHTACPPSCKIFSPRRNIPRPHRGRTTWGAYSWAGNFFHTQPEIFFGEKLGRFPRIMRAPTRLRDTDTNHGRRTRTQSAHRWRRCPSWTQNTRHR